MTPFSPCPQCGGNRAAANSHDPNPCTCPTGPIWGELINILPANYQLEEGQRLFLDLLTTDGRIPMQREWDGQWALIPAPEFHVLCLLALEVRDAIRRDLINLLEEDPTFALPCSIHEIVQAELAGELIDLRTGQRRRIPQATQVAA